MDRTSETRNLTIFAGIVAVFIIGLVLRLAKPVFFPFFLALFFYFILAPVQDFLMKLKISKTISLVLILFVTAVALYLMGLLFYTSGKSFAEDLPDIGQKLGALIENLKEMMKSPRMKLDPLAWLDSLDVSKVGSFVFASVGTFLSFLSTIFLVLIFLIFMLAGRGKLDEKVHRFAEPQRAAQLTRVIGNIDRKVQKYLALKTVISLGSGLLALVVFWAFGVRYAFLWAFITFILNYIPNIGSLIAKVLPFVYAVLQFGRFWPAAWMLIILIITDAITGMIIEPRLMGKGLGLSPLAILFALFFWGWLWGIPGMVLAVPIMVVMKIVAANIPSGRWFEALLSK
jgi:predicted PurR-regulated permease PerM